MIPRFFPMVMVMVISLGLYRSPPRYLNSSSGPARRMLRRASNAGREEPSLARPHFVGLSRLRYALRVTVWYYSPPLALGIGGVGVRPRRVRPFLPHPGSGLGQPASVLSFPVLSVLTTHTLPTTIACASGTLPLPLPSSTYLTRPSVLPSRRSERYWCA